MKKTLTSGAILDITRAPFVTSHRLFKTILKELKDVQLRLGLKGGQTLGGVFDLELTDEAIDTVKNAFLTLLSSQEIEDCLWECFERVTYENKRLDKKLFEDEKIAGDYLEIAKEVMLFNIAPFQQSLVSLFPGIRFQKTSGSQK